MRKNAKQVTVANLEWLKSYKEWVNPNVWTDRMLTTLATGVKRGKWYSLYDKVYKRANLENAFLKVEENDGSPGIDGITIKKYRQNLAHYTNRLAEELETNQYQPKPIQRTYIDKAGSKEKRPLGIPVIRDRVCQTALRDVIEPIFEKEFSEYSYGFRPKRGCKDALRQVMHLLKEGYRVVIDADIKRYFDNIDFGKLMNLIEERICDGKVLKLIEQFLKQDIVDDLKRWSPDSGTPQGALCKALHKAPYAK